MAASITARAAAAWRKDRAGQPRSDGTHNLLEPGPEAPRWRGRRRDARQLKEFGRKGAAVSASRPTSIYKCGGPNEKRQERSRHEKQMQVL